MDDTIATIGILVIASVVVAMVMIAERMEKRQKWPKRDKNHDRK
jgi:hypothetical protein